MSYERTATRFHRRNQIGPPTVETRAKSLWGNSDFSALVRDAEATLGYMHKAISESSIRNEDLPLEEEQQIEVCDVIEFAGGQFHVMPVTGVDPTWQYQGDTIPAAKASSELKETHARRYMRKRCFNGTASHRHSYWLQYVLRRIAYQETYWSVRSEGVSGAGTPNVPPK